jgi:hypothetical protein
MTKSLIIKILLSVIVLLLIAVSIFFFLQANIALSTKVDVSSEISQSDADKITKVLVETQSTNQILRTTNGVKVINERKYWLCDSKYEYGYTGVFTPEDSDEHYISIAKIDGDWTICGIRNSAPL